jgi:hypothetical protein
MSRFERSDYIKYFNLGIDTTGYNPEFEILQKKTIWQPWVTRH